MKTTGLMLLVVAMLVPALAQAHRFAPSLLEVVEIGPGRAELRWKEPSVRALGDRLDPVWPKGCEATQRTKATEANGAVVTTWELKCTEGLVGETLGVEGLSKSNTDVLLRVLLLDGRSFRQVLTGDRTTFTVPKQEGRVDVFKGYATLGVEHILAGWDHMLFVLGLVLLLGWSASLLWAITSFTIAHSITLVLATTGVVRLPQAPIEALIAMSIYFLAIELVYKQSGTRTLVERMPWIAAASFGLLHGLGFAGALSEVGLPAHEIPLALFSFNVGIEVGQLLFVFGIIATWAGLKRVPFEWPRWLLDGPAYAMGSLGAFWFIERITGLLQGRI